MDKKVEIARRKALLTDAMNDLNLNSVEDLCEKLGASRGTASTWRSRGMPENAELKYKSMMSNDNTTLVPIHYRQNVNSAGGYGALNDDESAELIMVPSSLLVAMFGLKNFENLDIIHVTGDSMKPIVENGDTIMIRRTSEVKNHQVAIVRVGDQIFIKHIDYHPLHKWVKLYSADREIYRDMDFEGDEVNEIEVIGVLVGKFKPY